MFSNHRRLAAALTAGLLAVTLFGCGTTASPASSAVSTPASTTTTTTFAATTTTSAATTTTTAPRPAEQAQVTALLSEGRVATIYRTTWNSIFGRLQDSGFLQESLTGRYKGEYVRSIGAFAILAVETGETAAAGKTLRFVTDTVRRQNLPYLPFTIAADGTVRSEERR